jgi:hypothetical protein
MGIIQTQMMFLTKPARPTPEVHALIEKIVSSAIQKVTTIE